MKRILLGALLLGACQRAPEITKAEAPHKDDESAHDDTGLIMFSAEQQKLLGFDVGLVVERELREELRVPGEIQARPGGTADVTAPLTGRLIIETPLVVGAAVARGAIVAAVLPPTNAAADLPTLELAEAEARAELGHAKIDRERAERLVAAGASARHRLEEAILNETTAKARLATAEARIKQYDASREAQGRETGVKRFQIRAPIDGVVSEILAVSGANVETGAPVFRIIDITAVSAVAFVPENEAARVRGVRGAIIESGGETFPTGRLLTLGRFVDPQTRTLPVTFELDNRARAFAIHQAVTLRLPLAAITRATAVLESAIVDEGASKVAYVRRDAEHFERRAIRPGLRSGGFVQILEGLEPGDRVVVRGGYLLRLASLGGGVPEHGHVH